MEGRKEDSGRQEGRKAGSKWEPGREHPEGREGREQMKAQRIFGEPTKSDHPPHLPERQVPSTLIIFRTKNTEKSRLGLIGKNFGKNLRENVSGKRKPPILWKGGKGC